MKTALLAFSILFLSFYAWITPDSQSPMASTATAISYLGGSGLSPRGTVTKDNWLIAQPCPPGGCKIGSCDCHCYGCLLRQRPKDRLHQGIRPTPKAPIPRALMAAPLRCSNPVRSCSTLRASAEN